MTTKKQKFNRQTFNLGDFPPELIKELNGIGYLSDDFDGAPLKIGTIITKANSEVGDTHPDGTIGKVIGSISQKLAPGTDLADYWYAVTWDSNPGVPISTVGRKLQSVTVN